MLPGMNKSLPSRRKRAIRLAAVLPLAAIGASLGASDAFAATSAPPKATDLIAAVKKAMIAAKSVHFEVTSAVSGTNEHIIADAGTSTGRQSIKSR